MKLVKVHIRRGDPRLGEDQMVYPARFDAMEVAARGIGHLAYSGHIGFGNASEWTIIGIDDGLADEYALDPDMEIVSPVAADTEIESWRIYKGEPAERVTDPNRIAAIAAKQNANIPLTEEDMAALDPNSLIPGVNRRRSAVEIVARARA